MPLNSPEPFASIAALAAGLQRDCLVGAGTVLDADDVRRTHAAGGRLVVAPNFDAAVIAEATQLGMQVLPGIATATEAFAALRAGATQLKLFPASTYGPRHLQALRTVLPQGNQHTARRRRRRRSDSPIGWPPARPDSVSDRSCSAPSTASRKSSAARSSSCSAFREARRRQDATAIPATTTTTGGTA